jgi:predicted HicB family RNase H-like nuclease
MAERQWGETMMNIMTINGYQAVIQYDPEIEMFRGEFVGLNGGADFYGKNIDTLRKEGETSLKVFLEMCEEDGVAPGKKFSGKFNLRVSPELHSDIALRAAAEGKSLNQWVADVLGETVNPHC